jgi:hypothetical protein
LLSVRAQILGLARWTARKGGRHAGAGRQEGGACAYGA